MTNTKVQIYVKTVKLKGKLRNETKMLQKPTKAGKNSPKKFKKIKKKLTFTVITVKV